MDLEVVLRCKLVKSLDGSEVAKGVWRWGGKNVGGKSFWESEEWCGVGWMVA